MMSSVEGLQGFALAAACLQLLIAAVFWGLRRWMPARGLDWLSLAFAAGALTNLPALQVPAEVAVRDSPVALLLIPVGLTALAALVVGLGRFVGRPLASTPRTVVLVLAWMLVVPVSLRGLLDRDLGGHLAAAAVYLLLIARTVSVHRRDATAALGGVILALACFPLAVGVVALSGAGPVWLRYSSGVPFSMLGVMLLFSALSRYHHGLAAELGRREQAEAALRGLNEDLEQRIEERTGELREMVSGLESFNRMVSHDLRGPLGGLQGLATLALQALESGDTERARRFLTLVETETGRLGGLVQDLLTLARVGHQPLALRPTPLDEVLEAALATLSLADGEAVRARVQADPLPHARADAALLGQVFVNLLSNALKFSAGGADVTVRVHGEDRSGEVVVEVRDHGRGFPPEQADRLFQPFGRLHGADVAGHGIGLTIVRRVVERHGGRVWAQGRPGQGASFFFSLPAA